MPPQVFALRETRLPPAFKVAIGLCLVGMLVLLVQLYQMFPPEAWKAALTDAALKRLLNGGQMMALVLWLLAAGIAIWYQSHFKRRARILLDAQELRFECGVPMLRRWLDWRLSLADVRAGKVSFVLRGLPMGSNALDLFQVGWGYSGLRRFAPARWVSLGHDVLQGEPPALTKGTDSDELPPHRPLGWVRWSHPENAAWLQQRYEALPLVAALRQQGITLPPLHPAGERTGVDLLRYPRLGFALTRALPVVVVLGAALQHLARYQHYFAPWPLAVWVLPVLVIALLSAAWLWRDSPAEGMSQGDAWSVRFAQVLVAGLWAVLLSWGLQAMPLVLAQRLAVPVNVDFVLDRASLHLVPEPGSATTQRIALDSTTAFWIAQSPGTIQALTVRDGWGLWQQYDAEDLNRRIAEFLEQQTRASRPAPGSHQTSQ